MIYYCDRQSHQHHSLLIHITEIPEFNSAALSCKLRLVYDLMCRHLSPISQRHAIVFSVKLNRVLEYQCNDETLIVI